MTTLTAMVRFKHYFEGLRSDEGWRREGSIDDAIRTPPAFLIFNLIIILVLRYVNCVMAILSCIECHAMPPVSILQSLINSLFQFFSFEIFEKR